jgi:hypothetical protein
MEKTPAICNEKWTLTALAIGEFHPGRRIFGMFQSVSWLNGGLGALAQCRWIRNSLDFSLKFDLFFSFCFSPEFPNIEGVIRGKGK